MLKSQKLAIAASVAVVFSGQSFAIVDGWDFSGQNARNEALQTDYGSLYDSYNIWVNPALVVDYSDRIDINLTDDGLGDSDVGAGEGNTSSDEEMGGVFKTFGGQALGAYIGRPSDGNLFNDPLLLEPENQFDLFWGMKLGGGFKLGARLNYQAIEDNETGPIFTDTNPNNTLPTDTLFTTTDTSNSTSKEGNDLNFALGLAFGPSSAYEATLLIGSPDATTSDSSRTMTKEDTLNGSDRTITGIKTTEVITNTNTESDDSNLGLALRGKFGNWLATFMYADTDRESKGVTTDVTNIINDEVLGDGALGADPADESTAINSTQSFTSTSEQTYMRLQGSYEYIPTASTMALFSLGLVMDETDTTSQFVQTQFTSTDNLTNTATYGSPIGTLFSETMNEEELMLPLVIALEGKVNDNWTARASIAKNLYQKIETTTTTTTYFDPTQTGLPTDPQIPTAVDVVEHNSTEKIWADTDTTVGLGFGYTKHSFTLDATLMKQFVTLGTDNGLSGRINVTYLF